HPDVEAVAVDARGQLHHPQGRGGHAAVRAAPGRAGAGSGSAAGRREPRAGHGRRGRRGPGRAPGRARHLVHRLAGHRQAHRRGRVLEYVRVGREDDGARLLSGGDALTEGVHARGNYVAPAVFTDATPRMRIAQEEIFGPVTAIIPVDDLDEAIAAANATTYGLSASIYTNDMTAAMRAVTEL